MKIQKVRHENKREEKKKKSTNIKLKEIKLHALPNDGGPTNDLENTKEIHF
jgi:translation initiation factor IF-3